MPNTQNEINILDLIDINFLQKLQDSFSEITGIPSIIYGKSEPITRPSIFAELCIKYIRRSEEGQKRCTICDNKWANLAAKMKKPIIYKCHSGLIDFVVPIIVAKQHIASIYGGQVVLQKPDEKASRKYAKELGIDENKYVEALRKVQIVDIKKLKSVTEFLFILANAISEIAHKNYELIKKNKKELLMQDINEKIRSSLNLDETLDFICSETSNLFNVQRAVIASFPDPKNCEIFTILNNYKTSPNIQSVVDKERFNQIATYWTSNILINKKILAYDNIKNSDAPEYLKDEYEKIGVKSGIVIPIKKGNDIWGILILFEYNEYRHWTDEEKSLLEKIATQIYIAINQAELYQKAKRLAQRETILRTIIETVRSSLDINEVKKKIIYEVGKAFKADRCYFRSYDRINDKVLQSEEEYLSSPDIKSVLNVESPKDTFKYFTENIKKQKRGFYPIIVDETVEKNPDLESYMKTFDIKADFAIPIIDRQEEIVWLVLHYKEDPMFSEDYKKLLETIAYQIDIAFEQIALYNDAKKIAEREEMLRKIAFSIRTSLNLEETFDIICSEIAKMSGANRVAIVEMIEKYNKDLIRGEFRTSESVKGANDVKFEREKTFEYIVNYIFSKNEPLIIYNIEESDVPEFVKDFYRSLEVKSAIIFPVKKGKDEWGFLTISYTDEYRSWSKIEIGFLRIILEQIYIAIKQSEMYERTLVLAQREALVRGITEKIRSSLNLDETLTFICEETASLFNVQRSSIIVFHNKKEHKDFELKKEYKSSGNLSDYSKIPNIEEVAEYWGNTLTTSNKVASIDNIAESEAPDCVKNAYAQMGVKSIIGTIISNGGDIWGHLILSEYNQRHRVWSDEEKELLKTISHQIYIAINQAELFENSKIMLEREKISRNIIEILRSSIDKKIIKKLFVKNIGKFFNADRVFFSDYDSDNKIYLPVDNDSEYLSNISEKSFIGYDWSNSGIREHIQPLLEKMEIKIPDWNEYVQKHPNLSDDFRALYDDSGIKSSYKFPVLYQDHIMGHFCLEFTQKTSKIDDEDLGRIRSICTQAGIAIYHAELYLKAQELTLSRESFVSEFFERVKTPTNSILDSSILLYQNEFERPVQIEHLNSIIISCNQLLELTKDNSK